MGFSFAEVDFGLPGGDRYPDDARSIITMEAGDLPVISQRYGFVGIDGAFEHVLALGVRSIAATLTVRAKDLTTLHAIHWDMENAKKAGGGQLVTTKGRTFERVVLKEVREIEGGGDLIIAAGPTPAGWVRQRYALRFDVLSGD